MEHGERDLEKAMERMHGLFENSIIKTYEICYDYLRDWYTSTGEVSEKERRESYQDAVAFFDRLLKEYGIERQALMPLCGEEGIAHSFLETWHQEAVHLIRDDICTFQWIGRIADERTGRKVQTATSGAYGWLELKRVMESLEHTAHDKLKHLEEQKNRPALVKREKGETVGPLPVTQYKLALYDFLEEKVNIPTNTERYFLVYGILHHLNAVSTPGLDEQIRETKIFLKPWKEVTSKHRELRDKIVGQVDSTIWKARKRPT